MKLGVFSDIHGNKFAFERIYRGLIKEHCDQYLFLGDVCGYYFHQNEVIDMLRNIPNLHAVAGNHDVLFMKALEDETILDTYTKHFGKSFQLLKENITPENLAFLRKLKESVILDDYEIAAFHGSPWNPLAEYVYHDSSLEGFDLLPYRVVFLGHTHYSMDIKRKDIRIVNPGSAGQPRNRKWPSFAVYNTRTGRVRIKHVKYNIQAQIDVVKEKEDPNHYLIEVLQRTLKK